jgi:hypothetical protein
MFIRSEFQKLRTLPEGYTESKEELIVDESYMLEEGFIERVTA